MIISKKIFVPVPLPRYEKRLYSLNFQNAYIARIGLCRLFSEIRLSVDDICERILPTGDYQLVNYYGRMRKDNEQPDNLFLICGSFPFLDETPKNKLIRHFKKNIGVFCDRAVDRFREDSCRINLEFHVSAYREVFLKEVIVRSSE